MVMKKTVPNRSIKMRGTGIRRDPFQNTDFKTMKRYDDSIIECYFIFLLKLFLAFFIYLHYNSSVDSKHISKKIFRGLSLHYVVFHEIIDISNLHICLN